LLNVLWTWGLLQCVNLYAWIWVVMYCILSQYVGAFCLYGHCVCRSLIQFFFYMILAITLLEPELSKSDLILHVIFNTGTFQHLCTFLYIMGTKQADSNRQGLN
jgi:hypothetical protein